MTLAAHQSDEIVALGSALLGWQFTSATPVARGGNNRIFHLSGARGSAALKFYPLQHEDQRDRLGQEYAALTFLAHHGVSDTPRPLARDDARRCAAYEWIEGAPTGSGAAEVDALANFFCSLQELRQRPGAERLAVASASCFSPAMVVEQFRHRLQRISEVAAVHPDLGDFLNAAVAPKSETEIRRLQEQWGRTGLAFDRELQPAQRVLSPSDFGLHNVLRRPDGRLAFVDFEYFGWDDPAKAIADVMLHPGMSLSVDLATRYREHVEKILTPQDHGFRLRLDLLFPLMALMWCLILLNEFLPERWARRALAGRGEEAAVVRARQLQKARNLFRRTFA
jgi:hypothetical protein